MGLFGKSKKEREAEYMSKINVGECIKQNFEMTVDEIFTIIGTGTVVTGTISSGMCSIGDSAQINSNGNLTETTITGIDVHTKERKPNGHAYCGEHAGLALRGIAREQINKGDIIMIRNAYQHN